MAGISVARVEPVSSGVHEPRWGGNGGGRGGYRRPARTAVQRRVVAAVVPDHDPEELQVTCDIDADGELAGLLITEISSGTTLARLTLAQVEEISARTDARGLFLERRG